MVHKTERSPVELVGICFPKDSNTVLVYVQDKQAHMPQNHMSLVAID